MRKIGDFGDFGEPIPNWKPGHVVFRDGPQNHRDH